MPHSVRSQLSPYYYYAKHRHKLPHCSTLNFLRLASKAARTMITNMWRSRNSMKNPRPTNLTTCGQLSVRFTPASPSPHTTKAQLSGTSLRVRWTCFGNMVIWICWTLPDYIGELHINDESMPDKVTKLVAGDVIHIDHDSRITFSSPNKAKSKIKSFKLPIS